MLEFKSDYFKEEERNGFTISETMKRAWATELDVLSRVIAVCKKYNLTYYAYYGTLLGTVRHHGYIPWDDDVDIALKYEDYRKLLEVLPGELPETFGISSMYTSKSHRQPWASVSNAKYSYPDPERKQKFYGFPYVAGIDIFPLYYVPRDKELADIVKHLYGAVYDTAKRFEELKKSGELQEVLPQIEELCRVKLIQDDTLRMQLWRLTDQIASLIAEEESDCMTIYYKNVTKVWDYQLEKKWFEGTVEMPFENITIAVPSGYDELLTKLYGDYMIPQHKKCGHSYPFYKKQKDYYEKINRVDFSKNK